MLDISERAVVGPHTDLKNQIWGHKRLGLHLRASDVPQAWELQLYLSDSKSSVPSEAPAGPPEPINPILPLRDSDSGGLWME